MGCFIVGVMFVGWVWSTAYEFHTIFDAKED